VLSVNKMTAFAFLEPARKQDKDLSELGPNRRQTARMLGLNPDKLLVAADEVIE
jgi:hypothetical protein